MLLLGVLAATLLLAASQMPPQWCEHFVNDVVAYGKGLSGTDEAGGLTSEANEEDRLSVILLSEARCPNCVDFIESKPLTDTLTVLDAIDFEYVPWGNAYHNLKSCGGSPDKYDKSLMSCWIKSCLENPESCYDGPLMCQHGHGECVGNAVQMCVIEQTKSDPAKYMPFIKCFESGKHPSDLTDGPACAHATGINWQKAQLCFQGPERRKLEHKYAQRTLKVGGIAKLGTPWVLVDGKAIGNPALIFETVCMALKLRGDPTPKGCEGVSALQATSQLRHGNEPDQVAQLS